MKLVTFTCSCASQQENSKAFGRDFDVIILYLIGIGRPCDGRLTYCTVPVNCLPVPRAQRYSAILCRGRVRRECGNLTAIMLNT